MTFFWKFWNHGVKGSSDCHIARMKLSPPAGDCDAAALLAMFVISCLIPTVALNMLEKRVYAGVIISILILSFNATTVFDHHGVSYMPAGFLALATSMFADAVACNSISRSHSSNCLS